MKNILNITFLVGTLLSSCSNKNNNNSVNEENHRKDDSLTCDAKFSNEKLNDIVKEYLLFLNQKQGVESKYYYTYVSFYKRGNDSLFGIGSSRVLPGSIDGTRAWLYILKCDSNIVLIDDNLKNPIGRYFYQNQGFQKYNEDTIVRPQYDGVYADNIEWFYQFNKDTIILKKKEGGYW